MKKSIKQIFVSCLDTGLGGVYEITVTRQLSRKNSKKVKRTYRIRNDYNVIRMISDISNWNNDDFETYMHLSVYPTISITRK